MRQYQLCNTVCPVSPLGSPPSLGPSASAAGPSIGDGEIATAPSDDTTHIPEIPEAIPEEKETDDLLCGECEDQDQLVFSRRPRPLPDVQVPSAKEYAEHCLTHLPYRRWCPFCVAARMPNVAHKKLPPFSRKVPLFVMDYCFPKKADDPNYVTVLVGKLYPYGAVFAVPCRRKGADKHVASKLAACLRQCGVSQFIYMSDQEAALQSMVKEAIETIKGHGEWVGPVPENSAVGESQSNARAEKSVQQVEDMLRTHLGELEARLKVSISNEHPIFAWLVEYIAVLINT